MVLNKIIIVDDTEMHRLIMEAAIKELGREVIQLTSGEELLEFLETGMSGLVLLDNNMEGISGIECLKKIRAKWDRILLPVIMVTASDDSKSLIDALNAGANDFITKPYVTEVVKARVRIQLEINKIMNENMRLNEVAAIANMIATYNHEINNPLTGAMGYLKRELRANQSPNLVTADELLKRVADIVSKIRNIAEGSLESEDYQDGIKIYKI